MKTKNGVEIPEAVEQAIRNRRSLDEQEREEALAALEWDSVMKCFFFEKYGMRIGVELDGYMHT